MSALKDVSLNVRAAIMGLIAEIERCKSVAEIRPLTNELRFWLDGDPLSVVNSLKSRLLLTGDGSAAAAPIQSGGDTPKMIIREMEGCDNESECCNESDGFCGESVIDLPEVEATVATVTVATGPTATATGPDVDAKVVVVDLSGANVPVEEKVLFSTVPVSLDRHAC